MKITIPKKFMGVPVEGAMERVLRDESQEEEREIPVNSFSAEGFIYIPPANIYFAKQRTALGENWFEAHDSLKSEKLRMPTIGEFRKTLNYLKDSREQEHQELYDEITQVRGSWRANWLDAYFEQKENGLYILTGNKTREEKLDEDTLMEDKRISLDSWLENPTNQGLPRTNAKNGELYFWHPRKGSVARFVAYGVDALLGCDRDPADRNSSLGVFGVADDRGNARWQKS